MTTQTVTAPTDTEQCPPWCVGHINPGDTHLSEGITIVEGSSVLTVDVEQAIGGKARVRLTDNGGSFSPAKAREIMGALAQQTIVAEQVTVPG